MQPELRQRFSGREPEVARDEITLGDLGPRSLCAGSENLACRHVQRAKRVENRADCLDVKGARDRARIVGGLVVLLFVLDAEVEERDPALVEGVVVGFPRPVVYGRPSGTIVPKNQLEWRSCSDRLDDWPPA